MSTVAQHWSLIRETQAGLGNFLLPLAGVKEWYCFFDDDKMEAANTQLAVLFRNTYSATPNPSSALERAMPKEEWLGFVLPADEQDRLSRADFSRHAAALTLFKTRFGWRQYLRSVWEAEALRQQVDAPALVPEVHSALWYFVLHYSDLLNLANREGRGLSGQLRELPGTVDFEHRLPTEQAVGLLLELCRKPYANYWDGDGFEYRLGLAAESVRHFITTHRATLERALQLGRALTAKTAEADFYRLYAEDLPLVLVQEAIDDASGGGIIAEIATDLAATYSQQTTRKLGDRIKSIASKIAKRKALLFSTSTAPATAPLYAPSFVPLTGQEGFKWYEIPPTDFSRLMAEGRGPTLTYHLTLITDRLNEHLCQLANHLLAPALIWAPRLDRQLPQWKAMDTVTATRAKDQYEEEMTRAERELGELEYLLKSLRKVRSLPALNRFLENARHFQSPVVIKRLHEAIVAQRREIRNQNTYRNQRMREFGIEMADENEHRKQLWLDEMLRIEEEVKPFLAYVRKAFSSALPVGTNVTFDPYRHRHDGVEFDPDTVQDQDKWLRGNVMKTLRGTKDYAPIAQVNTFCLDYSRSMTHDLMRDLFKVVFTLVMGLEGRRSYDAIHFFGSDFVEVVSYEDGQSYTNRSILFRVLRQVAEIYGNRIVYSGMGGTNISAGVAKSHEKMRAFTERLRAEQPDLKFVSSLFVLTDGQPTMGIINLEELRDFIEAKRRDGDVSIKGIFLKHPEDASDFITRIFGHEHAVESSAFSGTVRTFVEVMGRTYKVQRKDYRAAEKRRKLLGENTAPTTN